MKLINVVQGSEAERQLTNWQVTAHHLDGETSGICPFVFPSDLSSQLSSIAETQALELPAILLTVFQELLRRYTGQACVTVECRQSAAAVRAATLQDNLSVRQSVWLTQSIAETDRPSATTATDGEFSFANGLDELAEAERHSPIHLSIRSFDGMLAGFVEYESKTWEPSVVEGLLKHYETLLSSAISDLDSRIGDLEILREPDRQYLQTWNQTTYDYPHFCVDELFRQRAEDSPDHPAVTFEGRSITYRTLSEQTRRLADRLSGMGVGPGDLVGVCMDRCSEMVAALLAVFTAGGAYLPLDPGFPSERIQFMEQDARPLVVITQSHLLQKFSFNAPHVLCLDAADAEPEFGSDGEAEIATCSFPRLDNLAYVLYTSGSTGKPKGVQITHRALTNLLTAVILDLPLGPEDVFLATSTISFDISVFELFAPLISGAHLVVAPRSVAMSGELLADAIRTSGATLLQATPSGWRILLESGWQGQPNLKMLSAGEPLSRTLAHQLLERGAGLWNLYGPTEATIYASGRKVERADAQITVGHLLANYTSYVLDYNRNRVPVGAVGELYLGGIGVARGYLNRPELTADKFVANPFSNDGDSRLYRTGDLARYLPDGQIELLGRQDNQVKLRGYRIELEEIEALLDSHPSVRKSVVKVIDLGDGDQRLVAYIEPRAPGTFKEAEIREHALRGLPPYMVPGLFVTVEAFALTPNGKVDRKSLPALEGLKSTAAGTPLEEHFADEMEKILLNCWRSLLCKPSLELDSNFFEAGGHSLLAARMFAEIGRRMTVKLPFGLLVEAPTVRQLAQRIREMECSPIGSLVSMQTGGSLPPLYMVHHALGDILVYRALAECFAPSRPVIGVQAPVDLTDRCELYSIECLAAKYVAEMLRQPVKGPFHLAGFSTGSVLAFEMARQLIAEGHEVGMLALIDGDVKGLRPAVSKPAFYWKTAVRKLCKIVFKLNDELKEGPKQFIGKRLRFFQLLWSLRNLEKSSGQGQAGELTTEQALLLAENAYRPKPYLGSALLLRFRDEAQRFGPDPLMGWSGSILGGIEAVDLPGGHMTGMSPDKASHLASVMKSRMESLESSVAAQPTSAGTAPALSASLRTTAMHCHGG